MVSLENACLEYAECIQLMQILGKCCGETLKRLYLWKAFTFNHMIQGNSQCKHQSNCDPLFLITIYSNTLYFVLTLWTKVQALIIFLHLINKYIWIVTFQHCENLNRKIRSIKLTKKVTGLFVIITYYSFISYRSFNSILHMKIKECDFFFIFS